MFDTIKTYTTMPSNAQVLRAYVYDHHEALLNAAALLGGQPGARLARSVIDGCGDPEMPSCRTMRRLDDLLDLLMLEHVHDPDRIEAARFATIDPASAVVEEICLLADGLGDAMAVYRRSLDPNLKQQVAA